MNSPKILYISPEIFDYLSATVFHGLRSLLGENVVDGIPQFFLYKGYTGPYNWGNGFTLGASVDNIEIDRTDIMKKIESKYFDYIIYGVVNHTGNPHLTQLNRILSIYDKSQIVFLDGADDVYSAHYLYGHGLYFKRERYVDDSNTLPISFGFPKEKIRPISEKKTHFIAPLIPGVRSTYTYTNEQSYYDMYNSSLYALTWKKTGWDCMRHYEILGSGCMPLFVDLHHCPSTIMTPYPKELVKQGSKLPIIKLSYDSEQIFQYTDQVINNVDFSSLQLDASSVNVEAYTELLHKMHHYTKQYLTTENVAKAVLDILRGN